MSYCEVYTVVLCILFQAPASVYYIPNFITPEEGDMLWRQVLLLGDIGLVSLAQSMCPVRVLAGDVVLRLVKRLGKRD